ncbi:MAG: hypothetical protein HYY84_19415 [Deltaproteobacteria bacterium]|nr:hypothetical protein [Deltaproteobacteria bacterium]
MTPTRSHDRSHRRLAERLLDWPERVITKAPVGEMTRTVVIGLIHFAKQILRSRCRP